MSKQADADLNHFCFNMDRLNNRPYRVAFLTHGNKKWTAGVVYLKNLFFALRSIESTIQPEIVLLIPERTESDFYKPLLPYFDQVLKIPISSGNGAWQRSAKKLLTYFGLNQFPSSILKLLCKNQIDVLFSSMQFGPKFPIPLLSWIPDFQHRHLPENFSLEEIKKRDESLKNIVRYANRVILSSQNCKKDLESYEPRSTSKINVVPFVAQIPTVTYDTDPEQTVFEYNIPKRFFYLPNQFWKHKNHMLVLQALRVLKEKGVKPVVVCTGNTNDPRSPLYFGEFLAAISTFNLRDQVLILGLIPHLHVIHLMRQSIAVLQPSLFEGWSTTVEEIKSLGKKIILSDIEVHREQNPPKSEYFNPHDPEDLANCIEQSWKKDEVGPDLYLEELSRSQIKERTENFGRIFMNIVKEVIQDRKG